MPSPYTYQRIVEELEDLGETPEHLRPQTAVTFCYKGSYGSSVQWADFKVVFYDCDNDRIPGHVHWVKTRHYEKCTLFLGAQISTLWEEGSAVSVD